MAKKIIEKKTEIVAFQVGKKNFAFKTGVASFFTRVDGTMKKVTTDEALANEEILSDLVEGKSQLIEEIQE